MIIEAKNAKPMMFSVLKKLTRPRGNNGGSKHCPDYADCVTAFDIETTNIDKIEQSVMYIWQWHFADPLNHTFIGRTWQEFLDFCKVVESGLKDGLSVVVWVHNLKYEFQFLQNAWKWDPEQIFAVKSRTPLKATHGIFEFRCSYLQTNMSLRLFLERMQVEHQKLEMDYAENRYPWTAISDDDLQYAVNDVVGLCEAIRAEMTRDDDTLYTIPLTSTGYVRRDCKKAMRYFKHGFVASIAPDWQTYLQLKDAFRGGNTHANRAIVGKIINDVKCMDFSSSYPARQCYCKFPVTPLTLLTDDNGDPLEWSDMSEIDHQKRRGKAFVCDIALANIRLKDVSWPVPYISKSKCRNLMQTTDNDNGRVMSADYLEMTVTDIDLNIILDEYDFDSVHIANLRSARYGYLPKPLIMMVNKYFELKTQLKGADDKDAEIIYQKMKNLLNAIYGMSAQDPCKIGVVFDPDGDEIWQEEEINDDARAERLSKNNKTAVEPYQWGVWTTAHARYALEQAIKACYEQGVFCYCDTDSVYYTGEVKFDKINAEAIKNAKRSKSYAVDAEGKTHYMGVLELDGEYTQFKTLGAKKYAKIDKKDGELKITVAGVNKINGAPELLAAGGLEAFANGFTFFDAGGTVSIYNDEWFGEFEIDGHKLTIGSNIYIHDSTYTIGYTPEYCRILGIDEEEAKNELVAAKIKIEQRKAAGK